jgi:hypothetical protein
MNNMGRVSKKYVLVIIFCWIQVHFLQAQNNEAITEQVWLDFIPFFKINEKLEYFGDAGIRLIFKDYTAYRLFARPSVRYRLNPVVELQGGVGFFYSIVNNFPDQVEIRPWQAVRLHWPTIGLIGIKHVFKFEERLLWETDTWEYDPAIRFRYKLGARIPFNASRRFYLSLFGEVFFNEGGENVEIFRNRMRGLFGFGYKQNKTWTVEVELMLQRSRSTTVDDFFVSDRIFRLKVLKGGWVW